MVNYGTPQPVRVAWHEGGHSVSAVLLGHQPGPVTVIPNDARDGCCFHTWRPVDTAGIDEWFDRPPVMWPHRVRWLLETGAMISMAGRVAEDLIPDDLRAPDPFLHEALANPETAWPGPDRLTPAEQHDLAVEAARAPAEVVHDPEQVAEWAWLQFGPAERRAWRWGRWLRAEVEALLAGNVAKVERVAAALLEHQVLGGADVARLVRGG